MERPTDEEILKYERQIKDEEIGNSPLVSNIIGFEALEAEYLNGDPIYHSKLRHLKSTGCKMRTVKKDGNCFYRAFAFRFCELVRDQPDSTKKILIQKCVATKDIFTQTGYDLSIVEDFYDPFYEAITSDRDLLEMFTTEYISDTIVCFLRILTAALLKRDREMYEVFVLDSYPSLEAFIGACVEPMYVESDQIHIVAMANAFNITIQVGNLDTTPTEKINYHEISPMEGGSQLSLSLLFRPGHYDILYDGNV
ncbi:OTU domain, ubiquitin aldehyde binding [Boothiomyces sp. JEL0866]|nr:OTU domain, ubiquitin aldehyde binding [Boothiomyces sp. JEL0866]